MASADVSGEALLKVKESLQTFQKTNTGFAGRMSSYASENTSSCERTIKSIARQINQFELEIQKLDSVIQQLGMQIVNKNNEKNTLRSLLPSLEINMQTAVRMLASLNEQLQALQSQLSIVDDPDQKEQILSQIASVSAQLKETENKRNELQSKITESKKRISELESEVSSLHAEKSCCEMERDKLNKTLNRTVSKHDRLKSIFNSINSELQILTMESKTFETSTSEKMQRSIGSIDKCIAYIDEYLGVNI